MSTSPAAQPADAAAAPDATAATPSATPAPESFGRSEPAVGIACSKAGLVWVTAGAHGTHAVWHVWHDDAVTLVVGTGEQPDPAPGVETVEVTVPSKDTGGRVVRFPARVERLGPVHRDWEAAVMPLQGGRLNAPDAKDLLERWASGCTVLKLRQCGQAVLGAATDGVEPSGAAPVPPSPGTTVTWHPFHVRGRATRRRTR